MFYTKYNNNCHIVDDLKSLPVDDLLELDSVILLGGKDFICTSNYVLKNKKFDNAIYDFMVNPDKISYLEANRMATSSVWDYTLRGNERIRAYNNNGELVTICNLNNKAHEFGDHSFSDLISDIVKNYISKSQRTVYSNSFKLQNCSNDRNYNDICSYIAIPLNETHFMLLTQIFRVSFENRHSYLYEYACFCPYNPMQDEQHIDKKMVNFYYAMKSEYFVTRGLNTIFQQIKSKLPEDKYTKLFEEACFAGNYNLNNYLKDTNKTVNIKRASAFLSKILKTKVDLEQYYLPVFQIEEFASHFFNDISVTYQGEIMNCGSGGFQDDHFYQDEIEYFHKTPEIMKTNKKYQTLYKIVYNVANFKKYQEDIDPLTGDYYRYGELKNSDIIYKDDEGIIVNYRSKKYYVKKYGYFLEAYHEEAKELEERMQLANKLAEKE